MPFYRQCQLHSVVLTRPPLTETFSLFAKDPVITRFCWEIRRVNEPGSDLGKLMKYGKAGEARLKGTLKGHNDLAQFCFFNKIDKLPIIHYHTKDS